MGKKAKTSLSLSVAVAVVTGLSNIYEATN